MSAPLGPVGLTLLILAGPALFAFAVILGAGRRPPDPPWDGPETPPEPDQADIDRQFADITKHIEE